jgi:hypothetical protein
MEDCILVMFTHVMDFFREHASLKKLVPEHFFQHFTQQFVNIRLGNTWEFSIHIIHKTTITTLCNSRQVSLGAIRIQEQNVKSTS